MFLIGIVQKLQERKSLLSSLVWCASATDPTNMAAESQACIIKFDALVDRLHRHGCLTVSERDGEAKSDFRDFLQNVVRSGKDKFTQLDWTTFYQVMLVIRRNISIYGRVLFLLLCSPMVKLSLKGVLMSIMKF